MLNEKVIIVTGGAGYLGRSFVKAIVEQGAIAVIADLDAVASNQLSEKIGIDYPGQVTAALLDITNKESICNLIANIKEKYGRIDAVVNNAYPRNGNYGNKLEDVTYTDFCENTSMHLGGYFLVAQQFALFFRKEGGGNIVNIASIYGTMAPRFEVYDGTEMTMPVEYAAIKSSIVQLTRYFSKYFKGENIRINCLSPGGILDNQPEKFVKAYNAYCNEKGMLEPEDIAGPLIFLLSDASKYISAQNLIVDDGYSL
jgi:NAD(P)-dependent dehydrogenase (short-subunit alcohol dehydrogenase family)